MSNCASTTDFVFDPNGLHGPVDIAIIPGADIALVVSTNFDFSNSQSDPRQDGGALHVIDLNTFTLQPDSAAQLPNFGGEAVLDTTNQRVFVADRNGRDGSSRDRVQVFDYSIPGTGSKVIDLDANSFLEVGLDPFSVFLIAPTGSSIRKLFAANVLSGDLSLVDADTLSVIDLAPRETDTEALQLDDIGVGSVSFAGVVVRPNRIVPLGRDDLFFISTSLSGLLYVIDAKDNGIEAIYDLREISSSPQNFGMVVNNDRLFIASQGMRGVLILDVAGLADNGIDREILQPQLIDFVPTGSLVEGMILSPSGGEIYAANHDRDSVLVLDSTSGVIEDEIAVGQGPTEFAITDDLSRLLVTNFFSDSVTVITIATNTVELTIE